MVFTNTYRSKASLPYAALSASSVDAAACILIVGQEDKVGMDTLS
jgi:hypothetical protein